MPRLLSSSLSSALLRDAESLLALTVLRCPSLGEKETEKGAEEGDGDAWAGCRGGGRPGVVARDSSFRPLCHGERRHERDAGDQWACFDAETGVSKELLDCLLEPDAVERPAGTRPREKGESVATGMKRKSQKRRDGRRRKDTGEKRNKETATRREAQKRGGDTTLVQDGESSASNREEPKDARGLMEIREKMRRQAKKGTWGSDLQVHTPFHSPRVSGIVPRWRRTNPACRQERKTRETVSLRATCTAMKKRPNRESSGDNLLRNLTTVRRQLDAQRAPGSSALHAASVKILPLSTHSCMRENCVCTVTRHGSKLMRNACIYAETQTSAWFLYVGCERKRSTGCDGRVPENSCETSQCSKHACAWTDS